MWLSMLFQNNSWLLYFPKSIAAGSVEFAIDGGFAGYLRAGSDVTTPENKGLLLYQGRAGSDVTTPQNNFLAALLSQKHCSRLSETVFFLCCFSVFGEFAIDGGF